MLVRTSLNVLLLLYTIINSLQADKRKESTVLISIISRNEEHHLPTFFAYIERLNYPKNRISLLIQTDHNEDNTYNVLSTWARNVQHIYHRIILKHDEEPKYYEDSKGPSDWTYSRYTQILRLRQNALIEARNQWADYILFIDGDNFLLNPNTLNILINENRTIISPMLRLFDIKSGYSNYWGGITDKGYYERVPEYFPILRREVVGTFVVPMVHSTYLIHIQHDVTDKLQFYPVQQSYQRALDDILVFANSAKQAGLNLHICNIESFGYMLETFTRYESLKSRQISFVDTVVDYMAYNDPLIRSLNAPFNYPTPSNFGFDEIYMINLVRRPDRRIRTELSLKELGINWTHFPAVDGKNFTQKIVEEMGVIAMSDFKDPYLKRPLTFGEIGCFMSHWNIWLEMVERNLDMVLVLEDDVRFEFHFVTKMKEVMRQAKQISNWDLMYFGRKYMSKNQEEFVEGSNKIVYARYSYWTLGYVIRLTGAKKLIAGNPLPKMVPVDEYLPIMFDDHPDTWLKERFSPRNLIGLSSEPLLMYPTHYVGDNGYISDTEDTLSFQGESVEKFRTEKELELELENAGLANQAQDEGKPAVNKVTHGPLHPAGTWIRINLETTSNITSKRRPFNFATS